MTKVTACRNRSGVVAHRSTSMLCGAAAQALAQMVQHPRPARPAASQHHRDP